MPRDTNRFIFQINYLSASKHKHTSGKKVVALENYGTDVWIISAQEMNSSILSFLAILTCFTFVLPPVNFFYRSSEQGKYKPVKKKTEQNGKPVHLVYIL